MKRIGAVVVLAGMVVAGCAASPTSAGAEATEARLRQIVSTTEEPVYWLGTEFHGWPLDDSFIAKDGTEVEGDTSLDPGEELTVLYGAYCVDNSCLWHAEVGIQDVPIGENVVGCSRLAPLHGVPTVLMAGEAVILFTADVAIRVGTSAIDPEVAEQGAAVLRRFGASAPVGTLPPPPAAKVKLIDKACGEHPGDHGPELFEGENTAAVGLPDFAVPRLGGGQVRWADYGTRPVVVVAGDIAQVAPAVRRLAELTSGGTAPPVIGLAWDVMGDKEHPAPSVEIERRAGGPLPVPVGYPATYPAVWLSDAAGIFPTDDGVIGLFNGSSTPVRLLPSDASDSDLRAALEAIR
ncbi:hypothetical protein [Kribbella sp. NPDC003557]|uniref:hypothetical protein n=1 Tax=Kribbella sp. NPDC003557 TaxID=3154449 RepID=UPI0033A5DC22